MEFKPRRKQLTKEQAFQKLKQFCGYQQRCHAEVKEKLYSFGLRRQQVEELLSQLIEEGYLNEEQFAILFAGGKFRIKQWGRIKIKQELKQKQISEYCIRRALDAIDETQYRKGLQKLAEQKWRSVKGAGITPFIKRGKTTNYLLQKGFEPSLIWQAIQALQADSSFKNDQESFPGGSFPASPA